MVPSVRRGLDGPIVESNGARRLENEIPEPLVDTDIPEAPSEPAVCAGPGSIRCPVRGRGGREHGVREQQRPPQRLQEDRLPHAVPAEEAVHPLVRLDLDVEIEPGLGTLGAKVREHGVAPEATTPRREAAGIDARGRTEPVPIVPRRVDRGGSAGEGYS